MALTTTFPVGPYEAIALPPARRGEIVVVPLTVTTDSGTIQFNSTDSTPVATLYDGNGTAAVTVADGTTIMENAAVTDYDTAADTTIEARVTVDLSPPPAIDTYVLVMAAACGSEIVQASAIIDVR